MENSKCFQPFKLQQKQNSNQMAIPFKLYLQKPTIVVLMILSILTQVSSELVNIQISVDPNEANAKNTQFKFYGGVSDTIGQGSTIWMFIPQEVAQLQNGLSDQCTFSAPAGVTAKCSYQTQGDGRILYLFEGISQDIPWGEDLQVTIQNFNNPISTAETDSFEFQIYRQNGALVDIYYQDIFLLLVASDLSNGLSLKSSSDVVGEKEATLTVQFKLAHDMQAGQYIAIKFPDISDEASDRQKVSVLSQGASSTITPISANMPSKLPLEWDELKQTLYIQINQFIEGETYVPPGSFVPSVTSISDGIVQFSLYPIHNPISTDRLTGFMVSTMTSQKDGYIETTLGNIIALKVFTPYAIQPSELTLTLNETQTQKYSRYDIRISIDIPVDSGAIFEFQFPTNYFFFEEEYFKSFTGAGAVGGGVLLYNRVDQETQTVFTTQSGTKKYTNNFVPFIIRLDQIGNSKFAITTPSITLTIYDSQMNRIAENTAGLEATIIPGKIYLFPLEAHPSNFVLDKTYIHIKLQPESESAADAKLVITFPDEEGLLLPSPCTLSDFGTLVRSDVVCQSDQSQRTLTISNLLRQAYSYNSAVKIEFDVADIQLPLSSKPFGEFKFQIYSEFDGVYQLIDEGMDQGLFQPQQREMKFSNAIALNNNAYETGSYTFQIQSSAFIPQGGQIKVVMSDDVLLNSGASCNNFGSYISSSAYCSSDTNSQTITLNNGFSNQGYTGSEIVQFQVTNIRNPRSLAPSGFFQLFTLDQYGYVIEQSLETSFVEMTQSMSLADIKIETESKVVGEETDFYISFRNMVPLYLGDYLEITVPPQIQSYIGNSLDYCQGIDNVQEELSCYAISQRTLKVFLNSQIQPYLRLKILISELRNPNSTAETENFDFKIYDNQQYLVSVTSIDAEASVQMEKPCPIQYSYVTHSSRAAYETNLFTFTIRTVHELPPGSLVKVQWPEEIEVDKDADFQCTISTRLEGLYRACRPLATYVYLEDINDEHISEGTTIQIGIFGLKNSKFAKQTSPFTVTTMLNKYTEVDQASEGLVVENTCDWPCKQCSAQDPSKCLTCYSNSDYPILHENQCLRECPRDGGLYEANLRCNKCDESCQECDGTPNYCTSCPPDKYLLGHSCYDQCPSNSIVNEYKRYCVLCEPPCATCEGTVNQCTSCMLEAENVLRYFWQGECITECPQDITLWVGPESFCTRCNRNCATCSGTQRTCTSCRDGQKLDTSDQVCKNTCPELISVDMGDTCEPCDDICATCSSTATNECLTCKLGTAYLEKELTCVTHCPYGTSKVLQDGILQCLDCDEGCLDCQGSTGYCTACDDSLNFLFHQFTCVPDKCPDGFKRLSTERNTCVPENEICKYGYAYNDQAICVLAVAECPEGTILNQTLDKCVVLPGLNLPFLSLGLALLWTLYVLSTSFKRDPSSLDIISQLLFGFDFVLQGNTIVLIWLCSLVGLDLLSTINYSVLAFIIIENVILTIWVSRRSMVEDQAFKYWTQYNPKATNTFLTLSTIWSFKFIRAFYSKTFNGSKSFNAAFDTKFKTIVRPLFLVSMVHFSCLQLPLVMTDIYIISVIPPRYQNQITSVAFDNLLLQVTIFTLEIIEFNIMRLKSKIKRFDKNAEDQGFLPKFRKMRRQGLDEIKVKSNYFEGDDSLQSSKLDLDQSHLPLNILDWQHASTNRYKQQLHNISHQMAQNQQQKPRNEELILLESIVTRLKQKKKFKQLSSQNNIPDRNKFKNPTIRKNRIDVIKANKQKFSQIQRRRFVIRDRVTAIEMTPRACDRQVMGHGQRSSMGNMSDFNICRKSPQKKEKWREMLLGDIQEHIEDRKDYKKYLVDFKDVKRLERGQKVRTGQIRVNKSFDDEIMRADYEFMGDDLSQERSRDGESALSFPFCKDDHRIDLDDPREMADLEVFRDRIKRKFHYNNCGIEVQQEAIFRQPGAKATQTQVEAKDPFDTSESEISELSWVFSDDVEENLYQFTNNVARDLINKAIIINKSDHSSDSLRESEDLPESQKSKRQSSIDNLKQQSFLFEQRMRASQQKFEDLQRNGGQILQDHLAPAVQRLMSQSSKRTVQTPLMASSRRQFSRMASQKEPTEKSVAPPPLSLKEVVALKLRNQVDEIQKEMEAEGIDEEKLSGEEVSLARSELQRLEELSLGKPSDDEDDQKIKETAVNDNSSGGASEFQKFSAISQSKTRRKNKRLDRLERAYGNRRKNPEILSFKETRQKKKLSKLAKPPKPTIVVDELFQDLPEKNRQISERQKKKENVEPLASSRSSSNNGFRGSLQHGRSLSMPFDDEKNEQMREFISDQINNVMAKRGKNPKVSKDMFEDGLVDQEELNMEKEMNEILKNVESPKNLNIARFKDLFAPDDQAKHFPTTLKKKKQGLDSSLIGDSKNQSQDSSLDNEWKDLNLSDGRSSIQLTKLPKDKKKGGKFDKFEHLLFDNIIEQKIEKDINEEKRRQEELKQREIMNAPKAVAFYSSKRILAQGSNQEHSRSKMTSSRMQGNSLMNSQLAKSKIDSIKDIYNSSKPYQQQSLKQRQIEMSSTHSNQKRNPFLGDNNDSLLNQPYQEPNKKSNLAFNKRNSQVLGVNRSTSALGQPRGLSQIMKHNYLNSSSGALPSYKPDRESSMGHSDNLSLSVQKHDFHQFINPLAMSDDSGNLKDFEVNRSENSSKTLPRGRKFLMQTNANKDLGAAVAEFSKDSKFAREKARKKNAEQILKM